MSEAETGSIAGACESAVYDRVHEQVGFTLRDGAWTGGVDEKQVFVEPGDGFWRVIVPGAGFLHDVRGQNAEERAFTLAAKKARERANN